MIHLPLSSDCVGLWRFEESAAGSNAADTSGNGYTLYQYGSPAVVSPGAVGSYGRELKDGDAFRRTAVTNLRDIEELTIAMIVRPDSAYSKPTTYRTLMYLPTTNSTYYSPSYGIASANHEKSDYRFGFKLVGDATSHRVPVAPDELSYDIWHLIVATYSKAAKLACWYVDGDLIDSKDTSPYDTLSYVGSEPFIIGGNWYFIGGGIQWFAGADVDEAAVYNTVKNQAWVTQTWTGAPVVDPINPEKDEANVDRSTSITFTLTDDVSIVDGWQTEVKRSAGSDWETAMVHLSSPQFKAGWQGPASQLSTIPGGFDVTLDPLEPFDRGATVQVRVTAVDDEGNPCVLYGAGGATSYNGNPQDTIVVTEAVLAEVIYERQPLIPERVVLEETLLAETEYIRSVEDTVAVTDDVYLCSPEDTVAVTETMLAETEYIRSIEDAVAVTDDVCLIDPSDIVEVSDTVSRTLEGSRAAADTIEVTDAVGPELGVFCADGAVLEETLLVEMDYARAAADTVAVTDDVYLVDPSDAVVLTDDVLAEKL